MTKESKEILYDFTMADEKLSQLFRERALQKAEILVDAKNIVSIAFNEETRQNTQVPLKANKQALFNLLLNADESFHKAITGTAAVRGMTLYRAAMELAKPEEKKCIKNKPKILTQKSQRTDYILRGKALSIAVARNKKLREQILQALTHGPATISEIKKHIPKKLISTDLVFQNNMTHLKADRAIKSVKRIGNCKLWATAS